MKSRPENGEFAMPSCFFDRNALQQYVLICCQNVDGGICDKPGKGSDYYHTCYALAGLSLSQHNFFPEGEEFYGLEADRLEKIHPAFNLTMDCFFHAKNFFSRK
jgi:protein farnesyltransferase subunit beta